MGKSVTDLGFLKALMKLRIHRYTPHGLLARLRPQQTQHFRQTYNIVHLCTYSI